ncbi:MAG: leucine-rich repeat domain-containing protein [Peptococcaceae bacterium]|nr:leucine-rich repeat domain-containing protein [Peptococcaceae bacterium]
MWPFKSRKKIRQEAYRQGASDVASPLTQKLEQQAYEINRRMNDIERVAEKQHEVTGTLIDGMWEHDTTLKKHSKRIKILFALSTFTVIAVCFFGYAAYSKANEQTESTSIFLVIGEAISESKEARETEKLAEIAAKEREDELKAKELELKLKEAEAKEREAEAKEREAEKQAEKEAKELELKLKEAEAKEKEAELKLKEAELASNKQPVVAQADNNKTNSNSTAVVSSAKENDNIIESGMLNDNVSWSFDKSGTLTISGSGDMDWKEDYPAYPPFQGHSGQIKKIVIEEGITNVCETVDYFREIKIPSTVTRIEGHAFSNCSNITEIILPAGVEYIGHGAFSYASRLEKVVIPNGDVEIESYAFDSSPDLVIYGPAGSNLEAYANEYNYKFSAL